MPFFCYTHERSGETIEKLFPCGQAPAQIRENGKTYRRDLAAEHRGFRDTPGNWPRYSRAMGVGRTQIEQATKFYASRGVPVEFNRRGDIKIYDRAHERRVMEAGGFCHWNAGYGD